MAKTLASSFGSIDQLAQASYDQLIAIDEIGHRIAQSVLDYFSNPTNMKIIEKLKQSGVQLQQQESARQENQLLQGKTIVISGTFENHSRKQLQELIEAYGGKNTSSVSSKTDYLLAGDNAGSKKLEQARNNDVSILSEEDFMNLIGQS